MATLKVIKGVHAGRVFDIDGEQTVVGRHEICHVVLPARMVSRQHCRILRRDDGYTIEDMDSLNGTYVNERKVEGRVVLPDRAQIRIFDIELGFYLQPPGPEEELTACDLPVAAPQPPAGKHRPTGNTQAIVSSVDLRGGDLRSSGVNAQAKLRAVLEISRSLGSSLDLDDVLPRILDSLFRIFPQADRGYLLMADEEGTLIPQVIKDRREEGGSSVTLSPMNHSIAQQVMQEAKAFLSADAAADRRFEVQESVLEMPVRSVMCAPLMGPTHKPLGVIHIYTEHPTAQFDESDLEVLASVAMLGGQAVEHARSHEALLELDRRRRELATARQVQMHFLPKRRPDLTGYEFYHYYHAADGVAGDYFDYISLPEGRLAIALGDVAGKGISAALLMARFCSDVRYCLATYREPVEAVRRLNRELASQGLDDRFITFVLLVLDPARHEVVVINAGHVPPLVRLGATGEVRTLADQCAGPPLGVRPHEIYEPTRLVLQPGDLLFCCTDGVTEAMNDDDEQLGIQRVERAIKAVSTGPADAGKAVLAAVKHHASGKPQSDDICFICFHRTKM